MKLPPLNALRAFEAAARHDGFIGAAKELNVTRGAVSRHIKVLEAHLGVQLFRRHAQGVTLAEAGRRLLPVLSEAFARIAGEAQRISSDAGDLRIICPPATSIRWLIPRLNDFRERRPQFRVRLTTDFHGDLGFDGLEFDLGFSVEHWPNRAAGIKVLPLVPVLLTPACSPVLLSNGPALRCPADLTQFVLLHESPGHQDWTSWLHEFAITGIDAAAGHEFPNLDMAARAAVMGTGVVMADLFLCRDELASGTLVRPFPDMVCASPSGRICLLGSAEKWHDPKVVAFRDWIAEVSQRETLQIESRIK